MPTLTLNALNSLPCVTFAGSQALVSGVSLTLAQPISFGAASKRTGNFTTNANIIGDSGGNVTPFYANATNSVKLWAGSNSASVTVSDSVFHGLQFLASSTSSIINVDGTDTSVSTSTNGFSAASVEFGYTSLIATMCEGWFYGTALTSGNRTSLFNNMNGSSGYNGGL